MLAGGPDRLRLVKWVLAIIIVGLSLYYLIANITRGVADLKELRWQARWPALLASLALTLVCVVLGGWVWNLVLRSLGHDPGMRASMRVHLRSNVTKYVPGFAWQIVGKAYLTRAEGVPAQIVGVAIGLEFGLLLVTGVFLAALLLPAGYLELSRPPSYLPALRLVVALLMAFILAGLPWLARVWTTYARRKKWSRWEMEVWPGAIWSASGGLVAGWLLLGLAFHLLVVAVYPVNWQVLPVSIFSLIVSFLVSLLVIFIPSGIGVREGAMAYLMGSVVPAAPASAIAILARLSLVICETIGFFLALRL